MFAPASDGADGAAGREVEHGNDSEGILRHGLDTVLTVLVHEWVTGGGLSGLPLPASWAAEGRAMRRAIAGEFAALTDPPVRVLMTLDAWLPDEPGPWLVARSAEGDHIRQLCELARAADFTVVIAPETSGILAGLTRELHQVGARTLGSPAEAVELAGDKLRLAARLMEMGIDTPPVQKIIPGLRLPAEVDYPAVLKPVDGAGSVDTFYVADALSLPEGARAMPTALLQRFVQGIAMSASFLMDDGGQAWFIGMGIQRMAIRDGRFVYQGGTLPAFKPGALPQILPAIRAVPDLRGFAGVDFIWDPENEHATILEINPRPTTSCVGLCRLLPPGYLARAWLHACAPSTGDFQLIGELSRIVDGQESVSFDASGQFIDKDFGVVG
jgi:predicted ATP-grasp superfamily ATP-dependent carboligase